MDSLTSMDFAIAVLPLFCLKKRQNSLAKWRKGENNVGEIKLRTGGGESDKTDVKSRRFYGAFLGAVYGL